MQRLATRVMEARHRQQARFGRSSGITCNARMGSREVRKHCHLDAATRELSLKPVRAGIVLFNLRDKRIVQLQNTYAEIQRKGRIRVPRTSGGPARVYRYELPPDWSLVPSR